MSHAAGYALGVAIAVVSIVAFTPAAVWWRNRQLARLRTRHRDADLVAPVTKAPSGPNAAALVVDAASLRLFRLRGALLQEWAWSTVRSVRVETVRFGIAHRRGLVLDIDSRWEPTAQFVVFGNSWLKVSTPRTEQAAELIAHHQRGEEPVAPAAREHRGGASESEPI